MLFNSIEFVIFLPVVFVLYWFVAGRSVKAQNVLLLIASYVFYGWWDWRFLSLIAFSSLVDFCVGIGLGRSDHEAKRKLLLSVSILVNIGLLAFFKYFNFFAENFYNTFTMLGHPIADPILLNTILPVGISFYTFQTLSYSIDVYRRKLEPTHDIIAFFAFVSFFPQLVAGPIERAKHLLSQFYARREFHCDKAIDGMRQILWGLFKKIVIADNCAVYVDKVFSDYQSFSGSTLLFGAIFFAFQIYGDFSGYSDIAIGVSRLLGFNLMRNFAFPYFSRDIAEFWRRWHISLSTWFRDYVYIPLGGNRGGRGMRIRNTCIVFIVSGFWHGANWTFVVWGAVNAVYFLFLLLLNKHNEHTDSVAAGRVLPRFKELCQIGSTFFLTVFAWIFFRAESLHEAVDYIVNMFSVSLFTVPQIMSPKTLFFIMLLISIEWLQREKQHGLQLSDAAIPKIMRWGIYYAFIMIVLSFGGEQQQFIYFQF